jgi:hypothetical protein
VDKYFCLHDLGEQSTDTLIEFSEKPSTFSFRSAIDRFNGRYFFGGILPGHPGKFHIIDLVDFHIESFPVSPENMEYDYYRQKIVYEYNGDFSSLDLRTMKVTFLNQVENNGGFVWGQMRAFNPTLNQFLHVDLPSYYLINASTGDVICEGPSANHPHGMTTNHKTGDFIGHRGAICRIVTPCEGGTSQSVTIPDYYGHLNSQMAVFDQNSELYIVPFVASDTYQIAIVDVYNQMLIDIIDQPWGGAAMNLQQIYDKPMPPIAQFNDTLFVPKGVRYNWFRDNEFIGTTNVNYWVPQESGIYKTQIRFREYTTFSCEIQVLVTGIADHSVKENFKIFPNPVTNGQLNLSYDSPIQRLAISDLSGSIVFQSHKIACSFPIDLSGLKREGLYILTIESEGSLYSQSFSFFNKN